jgi:hypothetical protein
MDAVPLALIVFAVLFWDCTVSVLDRRVAFDYPERALAGILLQINACCTGIQGPAAELESFSFKSGFSLLQFQIGSNREPLFCASVWVLALQLLLDL